MMIETLIGKTIVLLNNVQMAHWQTTSYAQHEALGEFYNKMNELNDKLVETWQGNQNKRIHIESGQNTIQNFGIQVLNLIRRLLVNKKESYHTIQTFML